MAFKALDDGGLLYFWGKIKNRLLPTVAETDNGNVLTVVNGQWANQEFEGVYKVSVTLRSSEVTGDKTFAEIKAAIDSHSLFVYANFEGGAILISNIKETEISFGGVFRHNAGFSYEEITVNANNEWTINRYNL